ncbi:MAG: NADH-quinone oxidoreductase subunit L [Bacteroidetes bacterium GWE2_41_25]|nr:MAG: NADH-quinone oxidoreductase subunit L [Bacteroidetes bacterium GWA2_40_15]OFX92220.1 MAG: NADH-quinone oxidoreductase subunit L [Bacteroidetes bacterium GWC2_40_22]OFY02029.1 MAG: NADH-quinone oxidoreductase subunit L [Bacteroidetes bacterium GWE2_41_25]HBH82946.1 NADH-quinone oxidoreductase subunit L [Bacteroidales bacterium]HBQ83382.1 NADH-quinone oxidoreductase subunit L [Bacteroidales bacterium]
MINFSYTIWILLLPFLVFLLLGLAGHKLKPKLSGLIGTTGLGIITFLSYLTAYQYFFASEKVDGVFQKIIAFNGVWLQLTENLHIDIGILLDPISVMMLVVVTTVSFMVHIYSIGYMHGEKGFERFFAFLSLFSFSMLGLVVATNIFQMYIFWELVGVSSYLLIGFYYTKPSAVRASKKAFIVTRFADMGFLIGILILSFNTKTFDFITLTSLTGPAITQTGGAAFMGLSVITWSMIFVYMGGVGKSAMFPFHIWLPDAMEGPTPVSALIHAATMVVAGVYLVARMFPIYAIAAPDALNVVAYVGAFSSLLAAVIACTQTDIKRVLAYSTMSQIGYMMLALGVSGYGGHDGLGYMASMFHLFTHAMFKALLFLGAGAIIHAVHSNYMTEMGGLRKYLPITHATFLIACLTIAGIPPLSGFFSKDEILTAALHHNKLLFAVEYAVAGLTAFYMFRLYFSIFWRKETHYHHTPHEAPLTMTIPLIILAIGSVFSGFIPFSELVTSDSMPFESHIEMAVAIPSVLIGIAGIGIAYIMYKKETSIPDRLATTFKYSYKWAYNKFYIDEVYLYITKNIIFRYISTPIAWFDRHIVDGTMNLIAFTTQLLSFRIRNYQSGQLQKYGFVFVTGAIALAILFAYLWK